MISFDLRYRYENIPRKSALLRGYLEAQGRDVDTFPFMVNANLVGATQETFVRIAQVEENFSHLALNTIEDGRKRPLRDHLRDLRRAQRQLGLRRR